MGITTNADGSKTLTANFSARTETIPAGTDPADASNIETAFFATDLPPGATKAGIIEALAGLAGVSVADMTSFFAGTLA